MESYAECVSHRPFAYWSKDTYHTPFRCMGPIFTTWRTFSLLRIPSLLPRVMPATLRSLVPLIMWLSGPC